MAERTSVPTPLTSFVGRTLEVRALEDAMAQARLVTVVGPAGVGKTRLVTEVAGRIATAREAWFVELAAIDSAGVAETVAAAVGAPDHAPSGVGGVARPARCARSSVSPTAVVVFLDNCEHVVEAPRSSPGACWPGARLG
jgi:predicted ATPase